MKVVVVGAGISGLATAWFLQQAGADVEVVDRSNVAAGASWGNAGWLSAALTVPLPERALLREAPRVLLGLSAPASVPRAWNPPLWKFLIRFAQYCTTPKWNRAMRAFRGVNDDALAAYDFMEEHGVQARSEHKRILAACESQKQAQALIDRLLTVTSFGQSVSIDILTGEAARAEEPLLSDRIKFGVLINDSRFIDPGAYVQAIAQAVTQRGGSVREGVHVSAVRRHGARVVVESPQGDFEADAVVLATGAWLDGLALAHGVRMPVQAGRGYSFTVDTPTSPAGPIYLPGARSACTPYDGGLRVTGMMEFNSPDKLLSARQIEKIAKAVQPLYRGVDLDSRRDEWVGSRPVTPDGLPLVGATKTPGVFVAGGHGMWGITLGPLTGQLLAALIVAGRKTPALTAFDPLR